MLNERPETFLALPQRRLSLFAFGDVTENTHQVGVPIPRDRGRADVGIEHRTIFALNGEVFSQSNLPARQPAELLDNMRQVFQRMDVVNADAG